MSEDASPPAPSHTTFLVLLLLVGVSLLWLPPLGSSLWLDETYTYWSIKDGLAQALDRAVRFHAGSGLHFMLVLAFERAFGHSEFVLRLPSLLCTGLAAFVLYRLGALLFDRETGVLAAMVFCTIDTVAFCAADARSYGLGLLAITASMYFLVRWLRNGHWQDATAYTLATAAYVYCQKVFVVLLAVQLAYLFRGWRSGRMSLGRLSLSLAGLSALLLPLAAETLLLAQTTEQLSWAGTPNVGALLTVAAPPVTLSAVVLALVLATAVGSHVSLVPAAGGAERTRLIAAWAFVPPLLLFACAVFTSAKIFVPRYAVSASPGFALLVAQWIRRLEPPRVRRLVAQTVVALSVFSHFATAHGDEDWRGAIAAVRRCVGAGRIPTLVRTGTIDAQNAEWFRDAERTDSLLTPLSYYRLGSPVLALPWQVRSTSATERLETVITGVMAADEFVVITRSFGDDGVVSWIEGRVGGLGFKPHTLGSFGFVDVTVFARHEPCAGQPPTQS